MKRILVPLITRENDDIFTQMIDSAIKSCCSTCAGTNTTTTWEIDTYREGILSPADILDEIRKGKDVYAPQLQVMHTTSNLEQTSGLGKFIPVLKSSGVAVVGRKTTSYENVDVKANVLFKGIIRAYPAYIIFILVLILQGYLHWFHVRTS